MEDGRTATLEQDPQFVGAARGCHAHREPRQGAVVWSLLFVVHGSRPARVVVPGSGTYMPSEPVNAA
ncbi:hypothetical protein GCM10027075_08680 [Streptomyces heilongjiangensis]